MVVVGLGLPEVVMVLAVIVIKVIPYILFAVLVALVVRYLNARPRRLVDCAGRGADRRRREQSLSRSR